MKTFSIMPSKLVCSLVLGLLLNSCTHSDEGEDTPTIAAEATDGIDHSSYDPQASAEGEQAPVLNEEESALLAKDDSGESGEMAPESTSSDELAGTTSLTDAPTDGENPEDSVTEATSDILAESSGVDDKGLTAASANPLPPENADTTTDETTSLADETTEPDPLTAEIEESPAPATTAADTLATAEESVDAAEPSAPGQAQDTVEQAPAQAQPKTKGKKSKARTMATNESRVSTDDMSHVYIVQPGDTLSTISQKIYGTSRNWRSLAEANQISEANRIFPGDVIRFDATGGSDVYVEAMKSLPQQEYTVVAGDTLAKIAAKTMGQEAAWKTLWIQNKTKIPNPNLVLAGATIHYVNPQDMEKALQEARQNKTASLKH